MCILVAFKNTMSIKVYLLYIIGMFTREVSAMACPTPGPVWCVHTVDKRGAFLKISVDFFCILSRFLAMACYTPRIQKSLV